MVRKVFGSCALEEEGVGIDADGQEFECIQPCRVGYGQIVADAANMTETEEGAILALAVLLANPPPQIIRDE